MPEGTSSASRHALVSSRLGYQGLIICNHTAYEDVFMATAALLMPKIEVVFGAEVVARDQRELYSRLSHLRERYPILAVHGGPDAINRAACDNPKVDVLLHPTEGKDGLTIAAAKSARDNQVAIGFNLWPMVKLRGPQRSRWLSGIRRGIILSRKFELRTVLTLSAGSHLDLRAHREMISLAVVAGMDEHEAEEALAFPGELIELNRRTWLAPGVELL
jgi:ribonuclease P/MRP protein subunit RPP1